jgi:hypothetical protein
VNRMTQAELKAELAKLTEALRRLLLTQSGHERLRIAAVHS